MHFTPAFDKSALYFSIFAGILIKYKQTNTDEK
jgi:hypothetical protein